MGIFSKDLTNGYIFNFLYFLTFPFYDYLKFSSVAFLKYMYAKYVIYPNQCRSTHTFLRPKAGFMASGSKNVIFL